MSNAKTEGKHQGEFLLSEAPGTLSREVGTLSSGQNVEDGQVLKWSGGELIAAAGTVDSSGDNTEDIAGIAFGSCDASSSGPLGAVDRSIVYIARLAEVKLAAVKLYTASQTSPKDVAMKAALAAKNIVTR